MELPAPTTSLEGLIAMTGWSFLAHFVDNGLATNLQLAQRESVMESYLAWVLECQCVLAFERLYDERGFLTRT
jgi:hypothetical protein